LKGLDDKMGTWIAKDKPGMFQMLQMLQLIFKMIFCCENDIIRKETQGYFRIQTKGARGEMGEDKSKSNILNKKNGFHTRVNLYIIRYLYYHMKKADMFTVQGSGKRKTSVDLYNYIRISRQRFDRIFKGENFQMTKKESKDIAELFHISADYFKKESELVLVHGITKEDWECYFHEKYGENSVEKIQKPPREIKNRAEKVKNAFLEIIKNDYIAKHYDTKTALYHIHYYFKNGVAYKEVSTLSKFLEALELLKISDWKELSDHPTEMKKYLPLLKNHYEYVSSYIKCRELENIN